MADRPRKGRSLTPGQLQQLLKQKGCKQVTTENTVPGTQIWIAPSGQRFTVSLEECDDIQMEAIITQIERWIDKQRNK
jgi:hypothetical protein